MKSLRNCRFRQKKKMYGFLTRMHGYKHFNCPGMCSELRKSIGKPLFSLLPYRSFPTIVETTSYRKWTLNKNTQYNLNDFIFAWFCFIFHHHLHVDISVFIEENENSRNERIESLLLLFRAKALSR